MPYGWEQTKLVECNVHYQVAVSTCLALMKFMQIIPSKMLPERDEAALREFLVGCRDTSRSKGHFQIASISLLVNHIDPLAVLQSIYDPSELHCYIERAADDEAVAAAEAVVQARFNGTDRFTAVKSFSEDILDNTIAVGDLDGAFTGPHFFTAFTFDDSVSEDASFPAATVFLPRWQVSRSKGEYRAVANLKVEADTDIDSLVMRVWGAYRKFGVFEYLPEAEQGEASQRPKIKTSRELMPGLYAQSVKKALEAIDKGVYEKIVLARGVELVADQPWQPLNALNRLRERFTGCFTFSFSGGDASSFIGATPERLLQIRNGHLLTEAIAGSAPRGVSASEDAKYARGLLESKKDLHEHVCVRESILRRLRYVGVDGRAQLEPRLLPLANVQHLSTRIEARLNDSVHLLDVLAEMHPTPAVGGSPREATLPQISELEQIERGLYAGVIGWFNHLNEGEMIVGIRSALIQGEFARLYAGAGIVAGSDSNREMRETDLKLRALLEALTQP